ncbi:DNA-directed RNA polymerase I subunit RPA49-like [Sarcoptes scabiei]|nr:DNA-directed RNA polymerase I subunit RPA49-like [Sarcoptes scabiei]
MEYRKVYLNFLSNDDEKSSQNSHSNNLVYWPATSSPKDPKFSFKEINGRSKLVADDIVIQFESFSDESENDFDYYIAYLDSNKLQCQQTKLYRMLPNYSFKNLADEQEKNRDGSSSKRLSKREQLDELKGKFGSKKSQRDLAKKRKYDIQFGDGEANNLPIVENQTQSDQTTSEKTEAQTLTMILPNKNPQAKSVSEVYQINEIITELEKQSMEEFENELFAKIKNDFIKMLASKKGADSQQHRLMAIYADLLLQMLKLSLWDMRKADPLPEVVGDIKKHIFERFTSTKSISSRQLRYVITDQNRDRILIYICILVIVLNDFKPIDIEKMQTNFQTPITRLRRILELIGCYIENKRNLNGTIVKVAVFRLPLNVYKEPNKIKRLKT